jgi:hypothetical protein
MCFTRLGVPPAVPAVAPDDLPFQYAGNAASFGTASDAAAPVGTAPAPAAGSRRARRAEFDQLADTMLRELAASQTPVTLPGPMEGVLGRIGLTAGQGRARKGLGIAVVCAVLVVAFLVVSSVAGLLL